MTMKATRLETMDLVNLTCAVKPLKRRKLNRVHLPALLRTANAFR
jgi:hypothetical protein